MPVDRMPFGMIEHSINQVIAIFLFVIVLFVLSLMNAADSNLTYTDKVPQ